ncbi:unnamed protein product [Dicrocoelium dendriticum]|nr:unnamed protein product [Dicrocoelium dendriticum]
MQNLDEYRLSEKTGAMLESPLLNLPNTHEAWNALVQRLPEMFSKKTVRDEVRKLPVLSLDGLSSHEEFRFVHKILTFAGCAYLWQNGPGNEPDSLPTQLAVPLVESSRRLGLAATITHQDVVLGNCRYMGAKNLPECIHIPTNHDSWKPFIEATGLIEIAFAPAPKLMLTAISSQNSLDCDQISDCLLQLSDVVQEMTASLKSFYGYLRPEGFYMDIRPLLCSWSGGTNGQGLVYEGVPLTASKQNHLQCPGSEPKWLRLQTIGASAAQSICLQALDAFLQIVHDPVDQQFFHSNRECMIVEHRRFLEDLAKYSRIGEIGKTTDDVRLRMNYESLTSAMRKFRLAHLSLVDKFIMKPASEQPAKVKSLESTGTGGQSLNEFLQRVRNHTR